jgi:hypothetical protein
MKEEGWEGGQNAHKPEGTEEGGGGVDWERIEERGEPNGKVSDSRMESTSRTERM